MDKKELVIVPGWAICLRKPGQINVRISAAGLTEDEANNRVRIATDGRFAIEIAAVKPSAPS
jgi:hypothetical protein